MNPRRFCFSLFIFNFSLGLLAPAHALKLDRDQPLRVNAASVNMDEKAGLAVYRGNVVLVQGSLRIEADRLEVRTRGRQLDTVTAMGRPVRIRTLLDDRDDELKANADRVIYRANTRELELTGAVSLHQGGDRFRAERLRYALDDRRLRADGADDADGRAYAVIQSPRKSAP